MTGMINRAGIFAVVVALAAMLLLSRVMVHAGMIRALNENVESVLGRCDEGRGEGELGYCKTSRSRPPAYA